MYIIKVKGVAKIPDYVQLRDDKFTLLAYFRVDRPDKSLDKVGLQDKAAQIMNIVKELPFGQILKLEL
ncbi:MAG TPA: fructose-6-phosphate aldolase [Mucilaginibacter sp.]